MVVLKTYEELGSVSKAVLKCGILRSTLYRWLERFRKEVKEGLKGHSKRPNHLSQQKIYETLVKLIKSVRISFSLGPQGISYNLLRIYNIKISTSTIRRVLKQEQLPKIKRYLRFDKIHRYSKLIPGDRVQIDVTKIVSKCILL